MHLKKSTLFSPSSFLSSYLSTSITSFLSIFLIFFVFLSVGHPLFFPRSCFFAIVVLFPQFFQGSSSNSWRKTLYLASLLKIEHACNWRRAKCTRRGGSELGPWIIEKSLSSYSWKLELSFLALLWILRPFSLQLSMWPLIINISLHFLSNK